MTFSYLLNLYLVLLNYIHMESSPATKKHKGDLSADLLVLPESSLKQAHIEDKYDGIRAQLLKRGENWRLWSRGEELISDAYPDLEPLARALPSGAAIDGELVVLIPREHEFAPDSLDGLAIFASLQQRLGRKVVSEKTMRELPVAFIAYDLIESDGRDLRAELQHVRRALLEELVDRMFIEAKTRGERLPIRISPTISADTWEELAEKREQARALTREGLMLKARDGAYGIGRRKGGDRRFDDGAQFGQFVRLQFNQAERAQISHEKNKQIADQTLAKRTRASSAK